VGWLKESSVSLRFFGDDLDPQEVTDALGADPSISASKGEAWTTSAGAEKIAHTGMWRLQSERRLPGDADAQVVDLLGSLSDELAVWERLASRFEADLFCGLWLDGFNSGQPFSLSTLRLIADRHLTLDLDIYGDPDLEADQS
jgi:hypothetical protein